MTIDKARLKYFIDIVSMRPAFCDGGMTYRQWLVGQVLAGSYTPRKFDMMELKPWQFNIVDDLIKELAMEEMLAADG